jgi:hypothetical protein
MTNSLSSSPLIYWITVISFGTGLRTIKSVKLKENTIPICPKPLARIYLNHPFNFYSFKIYFKINVQKDKNFQDNQTEEELLLWKSKAWDDFDRFPEEKT